MPELLEPPPATATTKKVWGRPFVKGNPLAKLGTAASVAAAAAKRAQAANPQPQPPPQQPESTPVAVQAAVRQQLALVAEQIKRTRTVLNDDHAEYCPECERGGIQPHHRAQLLKALDTLLDRQRELLGVPRTGSLKPSSRKPDRREWGLLATVPEPEPAQPTPQPDPGPTGPPTDTTTGGGSGI